jgi:hypothetical protein
MARDHYIPAAYLGRFSRDASGARRDRTVFVLDRDTTVAYQTTPDEVAWLEDMYTLKHDDESPRRVDDSWTAYEQQLMDALDELASAHDDVDAKRWLRVLVPFVAGLFVRGPDFGPRHDSRLPPLDSLDQQDNDNRVRLSEQARILAPLMAAEWAVFTFPGPTDLVGSDRGYGFVVHKDFGRGFAVPLNSRQALVLLPNRRRVVLRAANGKWRAPVGRWSPDDSMAHDINRSVASHALYAIVAGAAATANAYAKEFAGEADLVTEPFNADWPSSRVRRLHEWDWLRALHVIGASPSAGEDVPDQLHEMDADRFGGGWMPVVLLGLNNPDGMNRGLSRIGDDVGLVLMDEEDLPSWPPAPQPRPSRRAATTTPRQRAKQARAAAKASRRANRRK